MTQPENQRVRRPATEEEHRRLQAYRSKVNQDLPDLRDQALHAERQLREGAMREPTVSGQLRCAIAESGIEYPELARQTGLPPKLLAEFMVGAAALDSAAIDKLAALLRQELKPIG